MRLELETFTPAEAEVITQVTQATVRNWRRAGYLPRPKGHARYTAPDLLLMSAMHALVSRGLAPEAASAFAATIAQATFKFLINNSFSYSQAVHSAARNEVGELSREEIEMATRAGEGAPYLEFLGEMKALEAIWNAAERRFGVSGIQPPQFFIIWANGEEEFADDKNICEKITEGSYDEWVQGPVTLFTLPAMAQMILDRLPRKPFILGERS